MSTDALPASWPMTTREVLSILAGTKTEHRVVLRPQPPARFTKGDVAGITNGTSWTLSRLAPGQEAEAWHSDTQGIRPPFGSDGASLYVREDYARLDGQIVYRADREQAKSRAEGELDDSLFPFDLKWKAAVHMPVSAARHLLDVKHVRLDQLSDMRDADAIAEGVNIANAKQGQAVERYERDFAARHDTPFDASLWVWIYEFSARNAVEPALASETLTA